MEYMLKAWAFIVSYALHQGWEVTFSPVSMGQTTIALVNPHDKWGEYRTIRLSDDLFGCQVDILEEGACYILGEDWGLLDLEEWCKGTLTEWRDCHRYNKLDFLQELVDRHHRCHSKLADELAEQAAQRYRKAVNYTHGY
jgi:hypothetical protein